MLYKTTERYYDLDISFIKHQGTKNNVKRKGVFILPLAHLPRRSEKHGLCKIGGGGGGQTRCIKGEVPMANRPFPSYKYSHFQNKAYCGTFLVKMSFICIRMKNKRECSSFSLDKKTIVISMASHLASLWNIGLGWLGNRLKEQKIFNLHASRGPLHCQHQSRMVCRMGIPHGRLRLVQEFGSTLLRQKIFTY